MLFEDLDVIVNKLYEDMDSALIFIKKKNSDLEIPNFNFNFNESEDKEDVCKQKHETER